MHFTFAILALWFAFYSYWIISAFTTKRSVRTRQWRMGRVLRFLILVLILLLFRLQYHYHILQQHVPNPMVRGIGVILCAIGLALAIWARLVLGRNWGEPMSLKEGHELVTSGPYSVVRHPIYSGMLLAMFGAAMTFGLIWFTVVVLFGIFFVYSAKTEERLMAQQFPDAYAEYKKRTKTLIPFVW